ARYSFKARCSSTEITERIAVTVRVLLLRNPLLFGKFIRSTASGKQNRGLTARRTSRHPRSHVLARHRGSLHWHSRCDGSAHPRGAGLASVARRGRRGSNAGPRDHFRPPPPPCGDR